MQGLGVGKSGPARHHLDLGALEQGGDAAIELVDDGFLPLHRLGQVEGRLLSEMPRGAPLPVAWHMASNWLATWMMALDGMQPRIRQVPPSRSLSTMTVSRPSCPARMAAT